MVSKDLLFKLLHMNNIDNGLSSLTSYLNPLPTYCRNFEFCVLGPTLCVGNLYDNDANRADLDDDGNRADDTVLACSEYKLVTGLDQ
jgi:hypothetical protein